MFTYGITCVYLEQIHLGALCIFMIYVDCAPFPWCYLINFFAYQLEKKKVNYWWLIILFWLEI